MEAFVHHITNKLSEIRKPKEPETKPLQFGELKLWSFWRAVLAELVGTMLFVFLGCMSSIPLRTHTPLDHDPVKISLAFGLAIMALIQIFGHVSGGHFNPSVSVGMAVGNIITPVRAIMYTLSQTGGAIIGGFILKGVSPESVHSNLGLTQLDNEVTSGQGVGIEIILTFTLVYVIIATTDSNRVDFGSVSVKIGLTVATLHLSAIHFTGASMNPSRSLGIAVASNNFTDQWVYWVGPLIGGSLSALMYKFLFNPYKGAITMDDAVQKLAEDGTMVCIPRDYFRADSQRNGGEQVEKLSMNL
ncbi:aquaporin-1-like [Pecten maximus]|uniref:aquaporin-1-like n=1 Tax=Pecten maximus TaxID=6579 RepID=UPI001458A98F|nr:aquaporin-1-like [Pecten maximus]